MNNKNKIYQEYFTGNMHEAELILKLDLIQEKNVKDNGVIYTPWSIVQQMITFSNPTSDMNIIEPSCGHGIFLIGLLYHMRDKYNLSGNELYSWFKDKVTGVEISQNTVKDLQEILSAYFLKHFNLSLPPKDFTNIHCYDGLTFENDKHFHLCIGNPPYIRAKHLEPNYLQHLKENYMSCKKGTIDIYFAFIEKYSSSADSLVFITPNSFLTSMAGKVLKNHLIDNLTLLIDFKEKKIFKDANVYTCILKTEKNSTSNEMIYGNDINTTTIVDKSDFFQQDSKEDGLIDNVLSEVATLCDSVYIVKKGEDGKFYATAPNLKSYEIESDMVAPYLKLTKIKSQEDLANVNYMIYPYNKDKTIIPEKTLQEKFPLTHKYLLTVKEKLTQRDKGKTDKYESWYAYGRKQGLHHVAENNIIIIPKMIGGECQPIKIDVSKLLKKFNKIVFTSGFIIPETADNKNACEHILGDKFIEFAKKHGKPWPGKKESYYSLTSKQIKKFNI